MSLELSVTADFGGLHRMLQNLHVKQVPYASALALTRLAQGAAEAEASAITETFDNPTPFTQKAFRSIAATKVNQTAYVAAKDIQAQYLLPYVAGGNRFMGKKRAMLVPKGAAVNQFGNLPRYQTQKYKGMRNVFTGTITFRKSGETISGIWKRGETPRGTRRKGNGEYGTKGKNTNVIGNVRTTLTLLVRFEDTTPAPKHLPFVERTRTYVKAHAREELQAAMRQAARTSARR